MTHRTRVAVVVAAVVVGFAASAAAQETTLIAVSRKQIQGVQAFSAASPITVAMTPVGDESVWIQADWAPADRLDPTKSFRLNVFKSVDNGQTWRHVAGGQFVGDPERAASDPVGIAITPAASLIGTLVRVELDVPVRTAIGFSAVITRNLPF